MQLEKKKYLKWFKLIILRRNCFDDIKQVFKCYEKKRDKARIKNSVGLRGVYLRKSLYRFTILMFVIIYKKKL